MHARTRWGCAAAALAAALISGRASAEERLLFEIFPDMELHELALQRKDWSEDTLRIHAYGGPEASTLRGTAQGPARPLAIAMGLGIGAWSSPRLLGELSSQLFLPLPLASEQTKVRGLELALLEGAHRIHGFAGLGGVDKGTIGADLELEGSLLHAGPYSTTFLRRDTGMHPFSDAGARGTLWPRLGLTDQLAATMPVSVALRRVGLDSLEDAAGSRGPEPGSLGEPPSSAGYDSQTISSSIGLRPYVREFVQGFFEIGGASWEKARFRARPGAPAPRLRGVERVDLRFLHIRDLVAAPEHDLSIEGSFALGGAWVWDSATKQEVSAFTFETAFGFHGYVDRDHPDDRVGAGFAVSRNAGYLADGSALTRRWRFELFGDVEFFDHRIGGSLRGAMETIDLPLAEPSLRDPGFRHAFTGEWYFGLVPFLQAGVHHASTNQCLASPGGIDGRWCHQIGVFLRLRELWRTPREQPKAEGVID